MEALLDRAAPFETCLCDHYKKENLSMNSG